MVPGARAARCLVADQLVDSVATDATAADANAQQLWVIRHAQPLVAKGLCYGVSDVAADPAATEAAAVELAKALPLGMAVGVSPLLRCEQLMTALRRHRPDLRFKTEPRISEMDFGAWEMQRWDDISPAELAAWTDGFEHYRVGGSGESVAMVLARVQAALDAWQEDAEKPMHVSACLHAKPIKLSPPPSAAWITHAGVSCALALLAQRRQQALAGEKAQEGRRAIRAADWPLANLGLGQWRRFAMCPARSGAG